MNNPFDPMHIQEEKAEREARRLKLRTNLLIAVFCAVLAGFVAVLYQAQIVSGSDYRANSSVRISKTEVVDSVRGEILDRYGRVLVTNEVSYYVTLDWTAMGSDRLDILARLLEICREEGVEWTDSLPISRSAPWSYTADIPLASQAVDEEGNPAVNEKGEAVINKTALGSLAEECGWVGKAEKSNLTAGELLTAMCQTFGLIEKTPRPRLEHPELAGMLSAVGQGLGLIDQGGGISQEVRQLAGVLYELYLRLNEVDNSQYVFAQGVDMTFISKVKENALAGVRIETTTARRYQTGYAAHVLGYTGKIYRNTWEYYKELGYSMDATVGVEGVELAFEEQLHGASGTRLIEKDSAGNTIGQEWRKEPEPGENVVLTLDIGFQATVEDLLAQYSARQEVKLGEDGEPEPVKGMAAAVVDMRGGVLALASYPTYDLASFRENFNELSRDESKPLNNRATMGLYAPGSTFKPLTAIAALDSGTIEPRDTVECTAYYHFYPDVSPACWIAPGRHGRENVTQAIKDSCNIFFYDVGRRTTIETLQEYARKFGLGEYTGIEISEYKGWVAGPEANAHFNLPWYGGDIMNAAIGQGTNQFTPLQLANYVATLVNGGNHYACHLLKECKSSDYSQVTETYEAAPLHTIDLQPEDLAAVKQGMYDLSKTYTMARWFSSLPVEVGCKTGTAETSAKAASTDAIFVCFAPYDDPQIALCIVAEGGDAGGSLAEIAAGIMAQYFSTDGSLNNVSRENTLLH